MGFKETQIQECLQDPKKLKTRTSKDGTNTVSEYLTSTSFGMPFSFLSLSVSLSLTLFADHL